LTDLNLPETSNTKKYAKERYINYTNEDRTLIKAIIHDRTIKGH